VVGKLLDWEGLNSWTTPANNFFNVSHYGLPTGLNEASWRVEIDGMVARPRSLTIADLKARPFREVDFTLECSGNTGIPFFIGGIGNAKWGGARLAPLLEQSNLLDGATEVIFYGIDRGEVTVRDNSGVLSPGQSGKGQPDGAGGLDLTITEQFARSMSLEEALSRENILCYEMNGAPLPPEHGFPVRLIAPGWYGVANVKWLTRIEVTGRRYTGRFMARDYVTIRESQHNGQTVWTFSTVGRARLKSAPAKVTRSGGRYTIMGAAWGAPVASVEVQIDNGPWRPATLDNTTPPTARRFAWRFWSLEWSAPTSGEHTLARHRSGR
jgi:DMSO/TMAO reductase YedYZ molybdopterin-dependent catalytic subunit